MLTKISPEFAELSSREPRIAFFIPSLRGGGAERAMILLASGMSERGLKVDFIVAQAMGPLLAELPAQVRLIDLRKRKVMHCILPLFSYLRRERPIALYSTVVNANLAAILSHKLSQTNARLIVRESNAPKRKAGDGLGNRLLYRLVPFFYQQADAVVAVSQGVAEQLTFLNPRLSKHLYVLPTPVVSKQLLEKSLERPDHPWFSLSSAGFSNPTELSTDHGSTGAIILGAGRLHHQKDFGTLIRAFALVRRKRAVRLIILGEGGERRNLEQLVSELGLTDFVSLPGFVPNPFSFMRNASVFVLSSLYEGMPNVLLQAMACGTPVVSTDCESGPREALNNGKLGGLVPIGDVEKLASEILVALEQPHNEEASAFVNLHYGLEQAVDRYLQLGLEKIGELEN